MHHLPRELCRCASLKRLVVDYNHLQSLLDEELRFSLEKLCVWGYRGSSLRAGWLQNLTSLSKLKIADFPHLCCMPEGSPTSLKIFSFYKCPNLSSVSALRNLTLENITVSDCPQLPRAQLEDEFSARGVGLRYKTNMGWVSNFLVKFHRWWNFHPVIFTMSFLKKIKNLFFTHAGHCRPIIWWCELRHCAMVYMVEMYDCSCHRHWRAR